MKITIESIPAAAQRYDTWGDWWTEPDGTVQIRVSNDEPQLPSANHQFLIALHELVEVWLCKEHGVTQEAVDAFDLAHISDTDPGDNPDAPYRSEHEFALIVEQLMAHELKIHAYGDPK